MLNGMRLRDRKCTGIRGPEMRGVEIKTKTEPTWHEKVMLGVNVY